MSLRRTGPAVTRWRAPADDRAVVRGDPNPVIILQFQHQVCENASRSKASSRGHLRDSSLWIGGGASVELTTFMKYLPTIAGILLGLLFIMSAVVVLFQLVQMPPPPDGTPAAMFMGAFAPTGYFTFIKVLELIGGILVAIPRTRNFGLLVLGPSS